MALDWRWRLGLRESSWNREKNLLVTGNGARSSDDMDRVGSGEEPVEVVVEKCEME